MQISEMVDSVEQFKRKRTPRSRSDRQEYVDEAMGDLEQIVDALDAMRDKAQELRDLLEEAGNTETMAEFRDSYAQAIQDEAAELLDVLRGEQ